MIFTSLKSRQPPSLSRVLGLSLCMGLSFFTLSLLTSNSGKATYGKITSFTVTQRYRIWYPSKARMRLRLCEGSGVERPCAIYPARPITNLAVRVNRAIDNRPGIHQEAICYQRFKQRLILSVSKLSITVYLNHRSLIMICITLSLESTP